MNNIPKPKITWAIPLKKAPKIWEIWKISASIKNKTLSWTRPVLIMKTLKVKEKIWIEGFSVCGDIEFAGKGDPVFSGKEEGVGYPFFIELYNPLALPEEYLITRIGKLNSRGIKEVKEMLQDEKWRKEESEYVWKFRWKEIHLMKHYRDAVPLKVKILALTQKVIVLIKRTGERYQIPWMFEPIPTYRALRFRESERHSDAYIRRLCIFLEEYRREKKKSLSLINEALFYLYLLQSKKRRAQKILKESKLNNTLEKFLKKPNAHRETIKKNLTKVLKIIYSELEEDT